MQVILFAFDCLFLDGVSLLPQPLTQRREALVSSMTEKAGQLQFATFKVQCHPTVTAAVCTRNQLGACWC